MSTSSRKDVPSTEWLVVEKEKLLKWIRKERSRALKDDVSLSGFREIWAALDRLEDKIEQKAIDGNLS